MIYSERKGLRIVGDCRYAKEPNAGYAAYEYWFESQAEAQRIADALCKEMEWPRYKIDCKKRNTKRTLAACNREKKLIRLYDRGQTLGTLIHELCHEPVPNHSLKFKALQHRMLIQVIDPETQKPRKMED